MRAGLLFFVDGFVPRYRPPFSLDRTLGNQGTPLQILLTRLAGIPGLDAPTLLLPDEESSELAAQAAALGVGVERFCLADVREQSIGWRLERWGMASDEGQESWIGSAFAAVATRRKWERVLLVPLAHLLVDRPGVEASLDLHQRERFDATFSADRLPGANWAILESELLAGMQARHPDLMSARGGLLWALKKPLYPFRTGLLHAPRDRFPLFADLRLNRSRVGRVLAAEGDGFALPGFEYPAWLRTCAWAQRYTDAGPETIHLEPTNECSGRCAGCPQPSQKRTRGFMPRALFDRIHEASATVADALFVVSGIGEPLLHPDLGAWLKRLEGRQVRLETSLNVEPPANFPWRVLSQVRLSVDALERTAFERLRPGCSWDRIEAFIAAAAQRKQADQDGEPEIGVSFVKHRDNDEQGLAFLRYWKQICNPAFRAGFFRWPAADPPDQVQWFQVRGPSDFLEAIPFPGVRRYTPIARRPCRHALSELHLRWDGTVPICGYDLDSRWPLGQIAASGGTAGDGGLLDLWNSPQARTFRRQHLLGVFDPAWPCASCQDWYHS